MISDFHSEWVRCQPPNKRAVCPPHTGAPVALLRSPGVPPPRPASLLKYQKRAAFEQPVFGISYKQKLAVQPGVRIGGRLAAH